MPSWNNQVTTDSYQEYRFPRTQRLTVAVSNNPVLVQLAWVPPGGGLHDAAYSYDGVERDLSNGVSWTWGPTDFGFTEADAPAGMLVGMQIKSEIPGSPAVVTIHA